MVTMTKLIALIFAALTLAALTLASPVLAGEVAVSSLNLTQAVQGNWTAAVNRSTIGDKNGSLPITLGGVTYASGIGARTKYSWSSTATARPSASRRSSASTTAAPSSMTTSSSTSKGTDSCSGKAPS